MQSLVYMGVVRMRHSNFSHSSKDPVCGAVIGKNAAPVQCRHNGRLFHFCSESCRDKFSKKPGRYLGRYRRRKLPPRMSLPIGRMKACNCQ